MGGYIEITDDAALLKDAGKNVGLMIEDLRKAIQKGGFDDDTVRNLVLNWTETGKLARGDGYWTSTRKVWRMTFRAASIAGKTSAALLSRLMALNGRLADGTDQTRFDAFNRVEEAMLTLVSEYRAALKKRDANKCKAFDGRLDLDLESYRPDFYRFLGD